MKNLKSFLRPGHLPTLLSALACFDVSFRIWVLLGAPGNGIAGELRSSPTQKGLIAVIPRLGGSLLRLLFGQLTDTIGAKKVGCL